MFSSPMDEQALRPLLDTTFEARFGFASAMVLRTGPELAALLDGVPFSPEEIARAEAANPQTTHVYLSLSDTPVDAAAVAALQAAETGGDRAVAAGRNVYLLVQDSIRTSKLAIALARLTPMTVRNLCTLRKVREMLHQATN